MRLFGLKQPHERPWRKPAGGGYQPHGRAVEVPPPPIGPGAASGPPLVGGSRYRLTSDLDLVGPEALVRALRGLEFERRRRWFHRR